MLTGIRRADVAAVVAELASRGRVLRTDEGEALYRRCSDGHHHHLLCRECGTAVEIEAAEVEAWTERVSRQHGFRDVDHTVEIIGICEACADAG